MKIPRNIKSFLEKYERHLSLGALLFGFTMDNLTLTRIDLLFDNIILLSYLTIAGGSILFLNIFPNAKLAQFLPYTMQYAFGGLFSGYVVFYSRSGSLVGSWPFLLMLLILLIGNEFLRKKYARLNFQLSIYFIAVFSFLIFSIPVVLGKMGPFIFMLSGMASIFIISIFIAILKQSLREKTQYSFSRTWLIIGGILIAISLLYSTNLIPPIPLALKEFNIYYKVERTGANYTLYEESKAWYTFYKRDEFKHLAGTPLYAYSAIFAPTRIEGTIIHEWQYFDEVKDVWITKDRLTFPIVGGRDGGYRGYSLKRSLTPGLWRVDVENELGQLLGRKKFIIVEGAIPKTLEQKIK